jgi:hypothetical protein
MKSDHTTKRSGLQKILLFLGMLAAFWLGVAIVSWFRYSYPQREAGFQPSSRSFGEKARGAARGNPAASR